MSSASKSSTVVSSSSISLAPFLLVSTRCLFGYLVLLFHNQQKILYWLSLAIAQFYTVLVTVSLAILFWLVPPLVPALSTYVVAVSVKNLGTVSLAVVAIRLAR